MSTGFGRPKRDHWAQRKDNNVERLTDAERHERLEQLNPTPRIDDDILILMQQNEISRLIAELRTLRSQHAEVLGTLDWYEAIAHTARLMLQRAWDDPVQQELRELLADELANLAEVPS